MAMNTVPAPSDKTVADPITVRISAFMERELERRGVFPELRLENARHFWSGASGATGLHDVGIERARELLADAQAQRNRSNELPRGTGIAYSALARNLRDDLRTADKRGLWDDPGMDVARQLAAESPACFDVGDEALYFEDEDAEYGAKVTVVKGYGLHSVECEDGRYVSGKDCVRFSYLFGYAVQKKGGASSFFCKAHQLTGDDCKPSHVRLVPAASAPRPHQ